MSDVGLVLGAGGVTGEAFHRGVLRALRTATGWDPRDAHTVVGTSAGSLVAASLRLPADPSAGADFVPPEADPPGLLPDLRVLTSLPRRPRAGALLAGLLPPGRQSTDFLTGFLARRHGGEWPDRPTWLVAVRRRDGRRTVFGRPGAPRTDVATAVAASCAIPAYFAPVTVAGEAYVDGGVHSPTNADLLAREGLPLVVVSSPMSVVPGRWALDVAPRLLFHRYLRREVAALRRGGSRVLWVEPGRRVVGAMGLNPLHALNVEEIESRAFETTVELLDSHRGAPARDLLGEFADRRRPVRHQAKAAQGTREDA